MDLEFSTLLWQGKYVGLTWLWSDDLWALDLTGRYLISIEPK
jgi:hypothetical protein